MISHRHPRRGLALLAVGLTASGILSGCGEPDAIPGTASAFAPGDGFWDAPFPGAHRLRDDGTIRLSGFPNPNRVDLVLALRRLLEADADGFGTTSTLYFRTDAPIDPSSLPGLAGSVGPDASVFLIDVDPSSPERGRRYPIEVSFLPDPGPFGAPNLIALLPLQGVPLREGTLHAAVLTRAVRDAGGARLGVAQSTRRLLEGLSVPGIPSDSTAAATFATAVKGLDELGVDLEEVAGLTAFVTGRPSAGLFEALETARPEPLSIGEMTPREVFEDFCVFETRVQFPVYQAGEPPFTNEGGGWARDANGRLEVQTREEARLVLTLPRAPAPPGGFPVTLFVRTGGGGDRPLVDRGVRGVPGGPALDPGTGPALELARAGFAGLSWDGPHGGLRNLTGGDEQFLVFNFLNPVALRDNLRQSALEAALLVDEVGGLTVTATACPGLEAEAVRLDPSRLALMGHSMGGTISPLVAAIEPRIRALVLSGAGGSWIQNVIYKESPVAVRPLAEILLDYNETERTLTPPDPALALLQWAGEPADPPVYARRWRARLEGAPRVLMMQGVVDTYILPPIANALSLAAGLDLGGDSLEPSLPPLLELTGATQVSLPTTRAGVVTQHPEGGIEDGHEVVFQTPGPKRQYRCFLTDLAEGRTPDRSRSRPGGRALSLNRRRPGWAGRGLAVLGLVSGCEAELIPAFEDRPSFEMLDGEVPGPVQALVLAPDGTPLAFGGAPGGPALAARWVDGRLSALTLPRRDFGLTAARRQSGRLEAVGDGGWLEGPVDELAFRPLPAGASELVDVGVGDRRSAAVGPSTLLIAVGAEMPREIALPVIAGTGTVTVTVKPSAVYVGADDRVWVATTSGFLGALDLGASDWLVVRETGPALRRIDGDGSTIYVAGGAEAGYVAQWVDGALSDLTVGGMPPLRALRAGPDETLWIGGDEGFVARFDGEQWRAFTLNTGGRPVLALEVETSNQVLVGGGGDTGWLGRFRTSQLPPP